MLLTQCKFKISSLCSVKVCFVLLHSAWPALKVGRVLFFLHRSDNDFALKEDTLCYNCLQYGRDD